MRIRPLLFWIHLAAGVSAGLVIVIMSATGAALALQPQILAWLERDVRTVAPPAGGVRMGAADILAAAQRVHPDTAAVSLTIDVDPTRAASVHFGRDRMVYIDPYSGRVLGGGAAAARAAFQSLTEWHRWLAASGESRSTARAVTGAANLLFCLLAISGPFLWWPRTWTWRSLRAVTLFQRTGTARARDFNWHNVIGFWCAPVLIVLTATGVVMSYGWANSLVYRVAGSPPPPPPAPAAAAPISPLNPANPVSPSNLNRVWSLAESKLPTWKSITLRFPPRPGGPLVFSVVDGAHWNAYARSSLTVNAATGDVIRWDPYRAASGGQKLRGWIRFAHTGELGGVGAQAVAGIACVGGVFLVWTGLSLAIRRLAASRLFRRTRSQAIASAAPAAGAR